jgi:general secretion pathway protein I
MLARRTNVRHGLSLLEVLIAMAVFLISYIAIWQLMNGATDAAMELTYRNEATRIAQAALARISIGDIPMQSQGEMSYDDDSDFNYSVEVTEVDGVPSLSLVSVTVTHPSKHGGQMQVQVSQMMIQPPYVGSTQDLPPTVISSTSSGTTTGTTGTSGTSGTSSGTSGTSGSSGSMSSSGTGK